MRRILCCLPLLSLLCGFTVADTRLTVKVSSNGLAAVGQQDKEELSRTWLGQGVSRTDVGSTSVIVDHEGGQMFLVNHDREVYHRLDLPVDLQKLVPESLRPIVGEFIEQLNMNVAVDRTEETREIGEYATTRHRVTVSDARGIDIEMDLWMASDVGFDVKAYKKNAMEIAALQLMDGAWMEKLNDTEGFPVLRETRFSMGGQEVLSREELVSVEELDAPAGHYAPPEDYESKPFDAMAIFGGP